jgi:pimeloyl-ACP methyl ester carboxylesterase
MKKVTEKRQLFRLNECGIGLAGTYHVPDRRRFGSIGPNPTGILLLNALSLPRASTGDSAVYWADSFAECGYPSFRIDLPGMGDSGGVIPSDLLSLISSGGYADVVSACINQLVQRFELSGVLIFGLCAGATSAMFAAAGSRECLGLILMDPTFHLPRALRPKVRRTLTNWAARSSLGGLLSNTYDRLKCMRLLLCGGNPPENANLALLSRWRELTSAGLPILLLKAPEAKASGAKPRVGQFDYLKYVIELAGPRSQVVVEVIEGADHPFANRVGRAGVRLQVEKWLNTFFPLGRGEELAVHTMQPAPAVKELEVEHHESMFVRVDATLGG